MASSGGGGGPAANSGLDLNLFLKDKFGRAYTCLHRACGMDFWSEDAIKSHISEQHLSKESNENGQKKEFKLSYKCLYNPKECGRKLDSLSQIMNHICKSHLIGGTVHDGVLYRSIFVCPAAGCGLGFGDEKSLKLHKNSHRQPEIAATDDQTKKVGSAKKHLCPTCGSSFQRPSHLKAHLLTHQEKHFDCPTCAEGFIKKCLLTKHQQEKHANLEPDSNSNKDQLNESNNSQQQVTPMKRLRRRKKPPKEYKCSHQGCGKEFKSSSKLARHARIHSSVRLFRCTFEDCKAEFKRRDHLRSHLYLHRSMKQFSCPNRYCHSKFKYAGNLRTHMKSHLSDDARSFEDEQPMECGSSSRELFDEEHFKAEFSGQIAQSSDEEEDDEDEPGVIDTNSLTADCPTSLLTPIEPKAPEKRALYNEDDRDMFESLASVLRSHDFDEFGGERSIGDTAKNNEHVINMNSDDEEYAASVVVLENLSGSARTDYRSNHFYINKNKLRCKKTKK